MKTLIATVVFFVFLGAQDLHAQSNLFIEGGLELESRFRNLKAYEGSDDELSLFYSTNRVNDKAKFQLGGNLKFGYSLSSKVDILSGLSYTNLGYFVNAEGVRYPGDHNGSGGFINKENYRQRAIFHSLSIPIAIRYHVYNSENTRIFGEVGLLGSYVMNSTMREVYDLDGSEVAIDQLTNYLNSPIQFGGTIGIGLEQSIGPKSSLIIKPVFDYYFTKSNTFLLEENLLGFSCDIGLKRKF